MQTFKDSITGNNWQFESGCWLCKFLDYLKPNHCEDSIK